MGKIGLNTTSKIGLNTTSNKNKISEVMLWIDISLMFKHNFVCLNTNLT